MYLTLTEGAIKARFMKAADLYIIQSVSGPISTTLAPVLALRCLELSELPSAVIDDKLCEALPKFHALGVAEANQLKEQIWMRYLEYLRQTLITH